MIPKHLCISTIDYQGYLCLDMRKLISQTLSDLRISPFQHLSSYFHFINGRLLSPTLSFLEKYRLVSFSENLSPFYFYVKLLLLILFHTLKGKKTPICKLKFQGND